MANYDEFTKNTAEDVYKTILLDQVKKITELGSRDCHEGFYKMTIPAPGVTAVRSGYVDDTWNAFENAVNILYDLLKSQLDKETKERLKKLDKTISDEKNEGRKKRLDIEDIKKAVYLISRQKFEAMNSFLTKIGWLSTQDVADVD